MKPSTSLARTLAAALLLGCVSAPLAAAPGRVTDPDAPRRLQLQSPVSVSWDDPSGFSELRHSHNRFEAARGNWVEQIARHLQSRVAAALPAGERMELTITDIERAGDYEPWAGVDVRDVRVVRDLYPPRMSLTFTRYGADGQIIAQGQRDLSDLGFLTGTRVNEADPLRFEKRMIDHWVRRELQPTGAALSLPAS
ncbi:MAG TPA: DUF3016 domain-containing protein [Pseudoxanthomonas sp.]|nr:DUF3016 domain-containing protein [Pseudoxanthomonas sp.]